MFARIEPDGVRWPNGSLEAVDVILWATGFRPAVDHLAPPSLRKRYGGIVLLAGSAEVQTGGMIGATRAGRAAALAVRRHLQAGSRVIGTLEATNRVAA
jgi:hypothetical protein